MKRLLIGMVGALAFAAFASTAAAQDAKIEKGMKVYADQKCSICHAIGGKGNPKGPLDEVGTKLTTAEIRAWITETATMTVKHKAARKPAMPAKFASLPKDDVDALVAYLTSLKKK